MKKFLTYIIFWLLFQFSVKINCQTIPKQRFEPTVTLFDNKLYVLGGIYSTIPFVYADKEFFYLDVSGPFNTKQLQWVDLSSIDIVPQHAGAASAKGGANNGTLFLYGGYTPEDDKMSLVYMYNPQSNTWSTPTIANAAGVIRTKEMAGVVDHNGKMYIFGGWTGPLTASVQNVNDMIIIDTVNLSYGKGSSVGAPAPRAVYGAVLLPDNNIIYFGKW